MRGVQLFDAKAESKTPPLEFSGHYTCFSTISLIEPVVKRATSCHLMKTFKAPQEQFEFNACLQGKGIWIQPIAQ